jgi:zinc protease
MKRLNPKNVGILAVGDIQTEELISVLNTQLNRWPKTNWNPQKISWEGALNTGVFLIDLPEEQQSNLRVLVPAWTELPTLKVLEARSLGIAMGGSFTSRLNNKLREEKGYTYGAYCSFQQKKTGTIFQASTSVRRDATAPALNEFLDTLNSSKQGFSQEEWGKSKSTMRNNIISQYESRQGTLSSMEELWLFERDNSFFQNQLHTLRQFGVESPTEFSHLFSSNRGIVIITGDSATIKEELAPWNPIDIDMNALLK